MAIMKKVIMFSTDNTHCLEYIQCMEYFVLLELFWLTWSTVARYVSDMDFRRFL